MRKTKEEAQKTRQHLLNAALEVFWRKGVTQASLHEIAVEAEVTRGALYWHFKNKEDLFEALFEQKFHIFLNKINDENLEQASDVWQHLRQSLYDLFDLLQNDEQQRKFCSVMNLKCERTPNNQTITDLATRYHKSIRFQIMRAFELSQAQQKLPAHIDLQLASWYLESNLAGLILMWISDSGRFDLTPTARCIIDTSMNTLEQGLLVQAA